MNKFIWISALDYLSFFSIYSSFNLILSLRKNLWMASRSWFRKITIKFWLALLLFPGPLFSIHSYAVYCAHFFLFLLNISSFKNYCTWSESVFQRIMEYVQIHCDCIRCYWIGRRKCSRFILLTIRLVGWNEYILHIFQA